MKAILDFFKKLVGITTEKLIEPEIEPIAESAIEIKVEQKTVFISPEVTTKEHDNNIKVEPKKIKAPAKKAIVKKQAIKKKK